MVYSNVICIILSLKESFVSCSFRWTSRLCNLAAHKAARICLSSTSFCFFVCVFLLSLPQPAWNSLGGLYGRCQSLFVFSSFNKDWSLSIYIYIYISSFCLLLICLWPLSGLLLLIFVFLCWSINDIKQCFKYILLLLLVSDQHSIIFCSIRPIPCFWEGT